MCGRYTLRASADVLSAEFHLTVVPPMRARYNVAPTQDVAVVTDARPTEVQLFRWGLVPGWAKDLAIGNKLINARSETLAEKPSFRTALKRRRCLVLADGFYEWRADGKRKTPIFIHRDSDAPFAIAGLWEVWKAPDGALVHSCTLVTTQPNALMAQYHDRMPVILPPAARARWLAAGALSDEELGALLVPYSGEDLVAHPVSPIVNMPANDVPACIAPA
jgi:putative SOS response-associated peptidase YedK